MQLQDQLQRDIFANEIHKNFSVIAPAGVGKTTAITDRITNFLLHDTQVRTDANSLAKTLAAVSYTKKAAKEIKERVYTKIFQQTSNSNVLRKTCLSRANTAFFGTIHAFASKFLKTHSYLLGLPNDFEIAQNDDNLWRSFLSSFGDPLKIFKPEIRNDIICTQKVDGLLSIARKYNFRNAAKIEEITCHPLINIENILSYKPKAYETKTKKFLQLLQEWSEFRKNDDFFQMPNYSEICNSDAFIKFCDEELKQLNLWQHATKMFFIANIAKAYSEFRINIGQLTHDDLINLSVDLLKVPQVISEIESSPYSVILDEAQDTDAQQFRLLLGISQKNLHEGISSDILKNFPDDSHFTMVGDYQQSIYCDRSDIKFYTGLHKSLIDLLAAEELTFSVTMRCPTAVVDFVNEKFQKIFSDINFVRLTAKPDCEAGVLEIIKLHNNIESTDPVSCATSQVSDIFKSKKPEDFGAEKWSDIAFLCPRKDWLLDIYKCFKISSQLPNVQLHFENFNENSASPLLWLTACLRYINNPADKREFAGILREIFGLKSSEIIKHFKHSSSKICSDIDSKFSSLRSEKFQLPLSKFLLKIDTTFKICERVRILGIFRQHEFSIQIKQLTELCHFAEASGMNHVQAETFLTEKNSNTQLQEKIDESAVQFVTFHKSKGLEWPVVVLPFMYRGRQLKSDSQVSLINDQQFSRMYSNECRTLYVACTRAKSRLLIFDDSEIFKEKLRTNMVSSGNILLSNC